MIQRSPHNSAKRNLLRGTLAVLIILGIAWLAPRLIALISVVILSPIFSIQNWFNHSEDLLPALWQDKITLQKTITELENELATKRYDTILKKHTQAENDRLRKILNISNHTRQAAGVIARPDQLPYDILHIDHGSHTGIETGAPIYNQAGMAIGLVSQVYPESAIVTLFSSPGFQTTVFVNQVNTWATLEGLGSGIMRVSLPQGIPLQTGGLVSLPSVRGGLIGQIVATEQIPTQPQQYGYITTSIPLQQLYIVGVGRATDVSVDTDNITDSINQLQAKLTIPPEFFTTSTTSSATTSTTTNTL